MLNKEETEHVSGVLSGMLERHQLTSEERAAVKMAIDDIKDRYTYRYRSARVCTPEPDTMVKALIRPGTIKAEGMLHKALYMAAGYFAIGDEVVGIENVYGWRYFKDE